MRFGNPTWKKLESNQALSETLQCWIDRFSLCFSLNDTPLNPGSPSASLKLLKQQELTSRLSPKPFLASQTTPERIAPAALIATPTLLPSSRSPLEYSLQERDTAAPPHATALVTSEKSLSPIAHTSQLAPTQKLVVAL